VILEDIGGGREESSGERRVVWTSGELRRYGVDKGKKDLGWDGKVNRKSYGRQ